MEEGDAEGLGVWEWDGEREWEGVAVSEGVDDGVWLGVGLLLPLFFFFAVLWPDASITSPPGPRPPGTGEAIDPPNKSTTAPGDGAGPLGRLIPSPASASASRIASSAVVPLLARGLAGGGTRPAAPGAAAAAAEAPAVGAGAAAFAPALAAAAAAAGDAPCDAPAVAAAAAGDAAAAAGLPDADAAAAEAFLPVPFFLLGAEADADGEGLVECEGDALWLVDGVGVMEWLPEWLGEWEWEDEWEAEGVWLGVPALEGEALCEGVGTLHACTIRVVFLINSKTPLEILSLSFSGGSAVFR